MPSVSIIPPKPPTVPLLSVITAANTVADTIGFNVLQMPPKSTVAEVIANLPIPDHDALADKLEKYPETVRNTIGAVTPGA